MQQLFFDIGGGLCYTDGNYLERTDFHMIDKKMMSELIAEVLHGGADFVEVFAEHAKNSVIGFADRKIESVGDKTVSGVGIRAMVGTRTFFATTTDMTPGPAGVRPTGGPGGGRPCGPHR